MSRTYVVQISLQNSGGKMVFSGGVPWNPPGHQQEQKYLGHLSVNWYHNFFCPLWLQENSKLVWTELRDGHIKWCKNIVEMFNVFFFPQKPPNFGSFESFDKV